MYAIPYQAITAECDGIHFLPYSMPFTDKGIRTFIRMGLYPIRMTPKFNL